jgi:DNA transformation protein and related proteins
MRLTGTYPCFILERLKPVLPNIRTRDTLGGIGLYAGATLFGLIGQDVLFFKTDAHTCTRFLARQMRPFRPFGAGGEVMHYYEVPADVIEDADTFAEWVREAVAVGRQARRQRASRTCPPPRLSL